MQILKLAILCAIFSFHSNLLARPIKEMAKLSISQMDFIHGLLNAQRLDEKMACTIRVKKNQKVRKFLNGTQWVEYLTITLKTDILGPRETTVSLSPGTLHKVESFVFSGFGPVEKIYFEFGDPNSSWMKIVHDGRLILDFEVGSIYGIYPCKARELNLSE